MREILFRGKRIDNGEWVYGGFSRELPNTCPLNELESFIIDWNPEGPYKVTQETVGEFSGLFDKNKRRIFEGDIVSVLNGEKGYVKFSDRGFWAFVPLKPKEFFCKPEYLSDLSLDLCCLIEQSKEYDSCVVVGNIYDNKNFLGVDMMICIDETSNFILPEEFYEQVKERAIEFEKNNLSQKPVTIRTKPEKLENSIWRKFLDEQNV